MGVTFCAARAAVPQIRAAVVTPLPPERYKLQVTLTRETHEKLRRAQLSRHALAAGDVGSIFDRALTLLIDRDEANLARRALNVQRGPAGVLARRPWLAYVSDSSGRYEVYVRPYPGSGARIQISSDGGNEPRWGPDSQEFFFFRGRAFALDKDG
jgi:hypothetical protein